MINGPNRPTCSVRFAPNAEPALPSCCRPATPKLCSFTSMRSQPKSLRALTLLSSSIKPGGMALRPSRFQTTSRSCSFRHARLNSTAKKISGNSCGRTGCRTEFSNPSTTSSITAATPGTRLSISRGKSCPSRAAIGQPQVTQSEDWYKPREQLDGYRYWNSSTGGLVAIAVREGFAGFWDDEITQAKKHQRRLVLSVFPAHSFHLRATLRLRSWVSALGSCKSAVLPAHSLRLRPTLRYGPASALSLPASPLCQSLL